MLSNNNSLVMDNNNAKLYKGSFIIFDIFRPFNSI